MILEGLITTQNADGTANLAPMGPIVDAGLTSFLFRPFQSSRTFQNLRVRPQAVFHVIDDVLLIAQAAIDRWIETPQLRPAERIPGQVVVGCCRWYELTAIAIDASAPRSEIQTLVEYVGHERDFFGFHRARHAVLEAAILATRRHMIPAAELHAELERLRIPVAKTAGPREEQAFDLLWNYIHEPAPTGGPS